MIEHKCVFQFTNTIRTAASSAIIGCSVVAASAIAGAFGLFVLASPLCAQTGTASMGNAQTSQTSADNAIRPFSVNIPEQALTELRRRILATQWPEKETVSDTSQGVPLAEMQELARYWASDYDWRKAEAKLNAVPQFITNIDGLDIHLIHVRSKNPKALPGLPQTHLLQPG